MNNVKDFITPGSIKFFEYHCWEDPKSSDAQLWYRSHQTITVLQCVNLEKAHEGTTMIDRAEMCMSLVYKARFADGHEGDVWEDEILDNENQYQRPDPPKMKA